MYKIVVKLNNKQTLTAITATFAEADEICTDILYIERYLKVSKTEAEEYNNIEKVISDTKYLIEFKLHGKTIAYIDVI